MRRALWQSRAFDLRTGLFPWVIGIPVFCLAAIWFLGFSVGVPLCALIQLKIFGREKWPLSLSYTACSWAFIYAIFDKILHVPFPEGQLFLWLGLS